MHLDLNHNITLKELDHGHRQDVFLDIFLMKIVHLQYDADVEKKSWDHLTLKYLFEYVVEYYSFYYCAKIESLTKLSFVKVSLVLIR